MRKLSSIIVLGVASLFAPPAWAADSGPAGGVNTPQGVVRQPLAIGDFAPAISATDLQGVAVNLQKFRGKPVILQFGSITDPIFRMHCPAIEKLTATFGDKAKFLLVYQREAHPAGDDLDINVRDGYSIAAPQQFGESAIKLATQAATRLNITQQTILVDAWNDASARRYGGLANMTFLIDAKGKLAAAYPWMDATKLEGALNDVLSGQGVSEAHRGPVRSGGAAITVLESDDGFGPAHFATVIDNLHLSDQQKTAIYPILADFVIQIRALRMGGDGQFNAQKKPTTTTAPAAAPKMAPGEVFAKIREDMETFKTRLKPLLTDQQYAQLVDGLNHPFGGRKKQQ